MVQKSKTKTSTSKPRSSRKLIAKDPVTPALLKHIEKVVGDKPVKAKGKERLVAPPPSRYEDRPRIITDETGIPYFAFGHIRFPVDGRSIEHTLGTGPWDGKGLVNEVNDNTWVAILQAANLPFKPLSRTLATEVVRRYVQRAWYEHYEPLEHNFPKLYETDAIKASVYLTKHQAWVSNGAQAAEKAQKTRVSRGNSSGAFARKDLTYTRTAEKLPELKGQQELVAGWFKKHKGEGATVKVITADLVAAGFKCNQDPERAIYYYLNEWKKKGWLSA